MDDFDVIFEGSPLAKHMEECGMEGELEKLVEKQEEEAQSLLMAMWKSFASIGGSWTKKPIELFYRRRALSAIVASKILDEDDLDWCVNRCFVDKDSLEGGSGMELMWHGVRDSMITMLPTVAIWATKMKYSVKGPLMCLPPIFLFWQWRKLYTSFHKMKRLNLYLKSTKQFSRLLKDVLVFLSDNDLVNQGYLMAKHSGHLWNTETSELLQLSKQSQSSLPGLRLAVLQVSTRLAIAYSSATLKEQGRYPLPYNLDHDAMHFPQFQEEVMENLKKCDDHDANIPTLRHLKNCLDVMNLRQLEYVKRVTSSILFNTGSGSIDVVVDQHLINEVMDSFQHLYLGFTLHKCSVKLSSGTDKLGWPKSESRNNTNDLLLLFRSVLAHIRQAVLSSDIIGQYIENSQKDVKSNLVEVEEGLKKIIYHSQSSELCLSKALTILKKMKSQQNSECTGAVAQSTNPKIEDGVDELASSDSEYEIPQDEVFELLIKSEADECEPSEDTPAGGEEIVQDSSMMMVELKSVLRSRAEVWEERERIARKRVVGVDEVVEDASPTGEGGCPKNLGVPFSREENGMNHESVESDISFGGDEVSVSACDEAEDMAPSQNTSEPAQDCSFIAMAAEAAAKACNSGLHRSEESYEFIGDDDSDF